MKRLKLILTLLLITGFISPIYCQFDLSKFKYEKSFFEVINDSTISIGNCPSVLSLSLKLTVSNYNAFSKIIHLKGQLIDAHHNMPVPSGAIYYGEINPESEEIELIETFSIDSDGKFEIKIKVNEGQDLLFNALGYHPLLYQFNSLK
ncbi:MAG: hypothetical protein ACE364_01140 [Chlorobiota bacterium]